MGRRQLAGEVQVARVFVSHASEDIALACELHQWLVEADHEVFLDRDLRDGIAVGEQWRPQLHERLRWADAVVCLVTSAYLASPWCTAEVAIAQSRGSRLLPVRAEAKSGPSTADGRPVHRCGRESACRACRGIAPS